MADRPLEGKLIHSESDDDDTTYIWCRGQVSKEEFAKELRIAYQADAPHAEMFIKYLQVMIEPKENGVGHEVMPADNNKNPDGNMEWITYLSAKITYEN